MDTVGPIAAGIAYGVVYRQLVGHGLGWRPGEVLLRRALQMAFAVVVFIMAVALISTVDLSVASTNGNLALRLDNAEARLTTMEQTIQNIAKQNSEMMSNPASSTSSKNPGYMTEEEEEDPPRDETTFPADRSEDSQDGDATTKQPKPWRIFNVPDDHVLVVDCVGDKLRVLIRPPSYTLDQQQDEVCGQAHEVGTPTMFEGESYRALFWQLPGDDR